MANHPNRGKKYLHPARKPDPSAIAAARKANLVRDPVSGELRPMTMREAANTIYATESAWIAWEGGHRPMHAGLWELFRVKTFDAQVLRALGLMRIPEQPRPLGEILGPNE